MITTGLLVLGSGLLLMAAAGTPEISRRLRGVYYAWWLVGISSFVMVISTVPLFHAMSVWAVALEHQFSWTRAQGSR